MDCNIIGIKQSIHTLVILKESCTLYIVFLFNKLFLSSGLYLLAEKEKKVNLKLKDGLSIDPKFKSNKEAHVLNDGTDVFSCMLTKVDIKLGTNSFYKMQVIEADDKSV